MLEDNTSRWSGNHLMDPRLVPGVLLVNEPELPASGHDLTDVTASILDHYGLPAAPAMIGDVLPAWPLDSGDAARS